MKCNTKATLQKYGLAVAADRKVFDLPIQQPYEWQIYFHIWCMSWEFLYGNFIWKWTKPLELTEAFCLLQFDCSGIFNILTYCLICSRFDSPSNINFFWQYTIMVPGQGYSENGYFLGTLFVDRTIHSNISNWQIIPVLNKKFPFWRKSSLPGP